MDLENRWKIGPFAHTCASVVGVSVDPSVVGRDWSPVSSNKARGCVTAVEQQATTEPHCSRGVQPGGICVYVVQREPTPGGPGSGLCRGRRRFLCQLPLWFYILVTNQVTTTATQTCQRKMKKPAHPP
jgi:hypothetical protein